MIKNIINNYKGLAWNSLLLLSPGAISSLLIFLLSANTLIPDNKGITLLMLNLLQLQMLGITIAKYGIDQIILSRLRPGNNAMIRELFLYRVFPMSVIFSIVIGFLKGELYFLYFLIALPIEVFVIIIAIELNINRKPHRALILSLFGYPLVLISLFFLNRFTQVNLNIKVILFIFILTAFIKYIIALSLRDKGKSEDIAILSYHIPLQQVGNFVMFRFDQLLIAAGLYAIIFVNDFSANDYLFLAKFPEISSGIIVALAPLLYKKFGNVEGFSIANLLKDKKFLSISFAVFLFQICVNLFFLKPGSVGESLTLYLPFLVSTLLILPTNLVTYVLIKESSLALMNKLNLFSITIGVIIFSLAVIWKSPIVFCLIIPLQLITYVALYHKFSQK